MGSHSFEETEMADFDFDKLMKLASDPVAFEAERTRIINAHIDSLPEERRKAAYKFQKDIDLKRVGLSSSDFISYCSAHIQTNLEQVGALSQAVAIRLSQMLVMADEITIPDNVVPIKGIKKPE